MKMNLMLLMFLAGAAIGGAAETPAITNYYHGVAVVDDYQWLEDGTNPAVRDWTRAQNERTHAYFDKLAFHAGLEQQLAELTADESASYGLDCCRQGIIFASRFKPPAQQPVLVRLKSVNPPALRQVVFDPNAWNTNGTTAVDWWVPSRDGRLVAICLSEKGSEIGVLHFIETATGQPLPDNIPGVQFPTGGGSAAWNADGTGVFYTRYPQAGERPEGDLAFYQQIWSHKLGTPVSADSYELGRDFPRIAEIELSASDDGQWLLATMANGDGGDYAHYLHDAAGTWHPLTRFEDGIKVIKFGKDAALYLLSKKNAPRGKILRLPLADRELAKATVVVPEGRNVVSEFEPSASGLYLTEMAGGPSRIRIVDLTGKAVGHIPLPPVAGRRRNMPAERTLRFTPLKPDGAHA